MDVLLTNNEQSISNICILDRDSTIRSDHFPITFDISSNVRRKRPVKRKIYNFKRANWSNFNKDLCEADWNTLLMNKPPDQAWAIFRNKLTDLSNKHIPIITVTSEFQPPWFDSECHNLCRKKERWRAKFKRTKNDDHYVKFSKCRRDFKNLVQTKMRDNLIDVDDQSLIPKKFWSYVKSTSTSHRIPECLNYKSKFRTKRKDQCDLFNDCFYHQFSTPSTYNINIDFTNDPMSDFTIHHAAVRKILLDINSNKAQGPDKVHGKVLKECAVSLAYPLSIIFNISNCHNI